MGQMLIQNKLYPDGEPDQEAIREILLWAARVDPNWQPPAAFEVGPDKYVSPESWAGMDREEQLLVGDFKRTTAVLRSHMPQLWRTLPSTAKLRFYEYQLEIGSGYVAAGLDRLCEALAAHPGPLRPDELALDTSLRRLSWLVHNVLARRRRLPVLAHKSLARELRTLLATMPAETLETPEPELPARPPGRTMRPLDLHEHDAPDTDPTPEPVDHGENPQAGQTGTDPTREGHP